MTVLSQHRPYNDLSRPVLSRLSVCLSCWLLRPVLTLLQASRKHCLTTEMRDSYVATHRHEEFWQQPWLWMMSWIGDVCIHVNIVYIMCTRPIYASTEHIFNIRHSSNALHSSFLWWLMQALYCRHKHWYSHCCRSFHWLSLSIIFYHNLSIENVTIRTILMLLKLLSVFKQGMPKPNLQLDFAVISNMTRLACEWKRSTIAFYFGLIFLPPL